MALLVLEAELLVPATLLVQRAGEMTEPDPLQRQHRALTALTLGDAAVHQPVRDVVDRGHPGQQEELLEKVLFQELILRLETDDRPVFVKTGPASCADMFAAEAEGLAELAAPQAIRVPGVLACGLEGATAFLAIEWLDFERPTRDTEVRFGRQLARGTSHRQDRENEQGDQNLVESLWHDRALVFHRHSIILSDGMSKLT